MCYVACRRPILTLYMYNYLNTIHRLYSVAINLLFSFSRYSSCTSSPTLVNNLLLVFISLFFSGSVHHAKLPMESGHQHLLSLASMDWIGYGRSRHICWPLPLVYLCYRQYSPDSLATFPFQCPMLALLCGLNGFTIFLESNWIVEIATWQNNRTGCYEFIDNQERKKRSITKQDDKCSDHMSGLAAAAFGLFINVVQFTWTWNENTE